MRLSWEQYATAVVRVTVSCGTLHVCPAPPGQTDGHFPDGRGRTIHIITAHNPAGELATDEANQAAHARLLQVVQERTREFYPAAGGDPEWTHVEQSLAVIGLDDEQACALGQQFVQDAIFAWTPTQWSVIACAGTRCLVSGWRVARSDPHLSPLPSSGSGIDGGVS